MSTTLPRHRVRLSVDPCAHAGLQCRIQEAAPKIWRGTDVYVEIGLYFDGIFIDAITGITSVHLDLLPGNDHDASPLVQKTVLAAAMSAITEAEWTGNTAAKYNARFDLPHADTQFDMTLATDNVLSLWCVIHALMATGDYITLAAGQIQVEEDGAQNGLTVITSPVPTPAYRVSDGELQLWNPDQSKWHTLYVKGAAGVEYLAIGPGET